MPKQRKNLKMRRDVAYIYETGFFENTYHGEKKSVRFTESIS